MDSERREIGMSDVEMAKAGEFRQPLVVRRGRGRRSGWWARRTRACRAAAEAGMSTAEYAVGTIAACGFAAVLYKIVTSGPVRTALTGVITKALHVSF
jgi:hypothetical protein